MANPYERDPRAAARTTRSASAGRWIIVGLVALGLGSVTYFWWTSRARSIAAPPAATSETHVAVGSHRPKRQPMEIPPLDLSDALVRDVVSKLSNSPILERLLATKDLVRTAALTVEMISDGKTPTVPLRPIRPAMRLAISNDDSGHITAASYARWDAAATTLTAIRPNEAAQCYVNIKELFDAAYRELGHPDQSFDTAIVRAIQELRDTPEIKTEPTLVRKPGYFEHADPALAALPPVQKQFLLIGAENRTRVLDWLKAFAAALDLKID
jgi:hypothetical protein